MVTAEGKKQVSIVVAEDTKQRRGAAMKKGQRKRCPQVFVQTAVFQRPRRRATRRRARAFFMADLVGWIDGRGLSHITPVTVGSAAGGCLRGANCRENRPHA